MFKNIQFNGRFLAAMAAIALVLGLIGLNLDLVLPAAQHATKDAPISIKPVEPTNPPAPPSEPPPSQPPTSEPPATEPKLPASNMGGGGGGAGGPSLIVVVLFAVLANRNFFRSAQPRCRRRHTSASLTSTVV